MGYGFTQTSGNKNVIALYDDSGVQVAAYSYGPFGQLLSASGPLAQINPLRFSSEYFDDETGLVYYNYRYYSPRLGRWLSRDPIGETGGLNLYGMLGNNVVNAWDRLGLEALGLKLWNFYFDRVIIGMSPGGFLKNLATRYVVFSFNDDENELVERKESNLKNLIHAALVESAKQQKVTDTWQRLFFERRNIGQANISTYGIQSAGYLLATSFANYIEGTCLVKKCGEKFLFKQIKISYEWFDEVDANSLLETLNRYYKTDTNTYFDALIDAAKDIGPLFECIPDLIGDKALMAGYYVNIRGCYIYDDELLLPKI